MNEVNTNKAEETTQEFVTVTKDTVIDGIKINSGELLLVKNVITPKLPQSPYNGVSYFKISGKWSAKVLLNPDENGKRKLKHVGYFTNDKEAAIARNKYIEEHNLICKKCKLEE